MLALSKKEGIYMYTNKKEIRHKKGRENGWGDRETPNSLVFILLLAHEILLSSSVDYRKVGNDVILSLLTV